MTLPLVGQAAWASDLVRENSVNSIAGRRLLSCVLGFSAVVALLAACTTPRLAPARASPTQVTAATAMPTAPPTNTPVLARPGPMRVLFVGNSLTFSHDLPQVFAELARASGHSVEVDMAAQGGQTLAGHAASPGTLQKLTGQRWDFVVLQEQSRIPAMTAQRDEQMIPAARLLDKKAAESGAETVLFLTWAGRDGLPSAGLEDYVAMQSAIEAGYMEVAGEIGAMVAPVGVAWQWALEEHPELGLWQRDGSHPSPEGTYLAACVFYATLLGESPEGAGELAGLPEETARFLQALAGETVLGDPGRWHIP